MKILGISVTLNDISRVSQYTTIASRVRSVAAIFFAICALGCVVNPIGTRVVWAMAMGVAFLVAVAANAIADKLISIHHSLSQMEHLAVRATIQGTLRKNS